MKVGFIGTGTMGGMLVQRLIEHGTLEPTETVLFNRTRAKADSLAQRWPGISVVDRLTEAIEQSAIIFLCVKPQDYASVLGSCAGLLTSDKILISITSPVTIARLEATVRAKVGKLIPSVTNSVHSGVALYTFGERLTAEDKSRLLAFYAALGTPFEIRERYTRIASDISSCGPAFLSFLLELWIQAAIHRTGLSANVARELIAQMVNGLARLLTEDGVTTPEIIAKVAVPGGITAAGLTCLRDHCDGIFDQLIGLTHSKFAEDCESVDRQLLELIPNHTFGEQVAGEIMD